jgi:hypothetical protein
MSQFSVAFFATFAMLFTSPTTFALRRSALDLSAVVVGLQGVGVRKNFFYVGGMPTSMAIAGSKLKMRSGWCPSVPI